jgi:Tfp pilus assembly protein PilE
MRRVGKIAKVVSIALIAGLSASAWTSQVSARETKRDAAMAKCIQRAERQYPRNDGTQRQQRTAVYKDCMVSAGVHP